MRATPTNQIIIIGPARSGTRFLRRVLAASADVAATEFDLNHVWRTGNDDAPDDVLQPGSCDPDTIRFIADRLAALARGPRDATTLVEKTVSNALRVPFVRTVFPDARLVRLVRDGRETVLSALSAWTTPSTWSYRLAKLRTFEPRDLRYLRRVVGPSTPGTWGPRYPGIDEDRRHLPLHQVVARQWAACVSAAADAFAAEPAAVEVRYEDLISREATVLELAERLDLQADRMVALWRETRVPRPPAWPGALSDEEQADILTIIQPGLRRLGYV